MFILIATNFPGILLKSVLGINEVYISSVSGYALVNLATIHKRVTRSWAKNNTFSLVSLKKVLHLCL